MPKTVGDVVVAVGPGGSVANDPNMVVNGAATGRTVSCRKTERSNRAGNPDGVREGSEVAIEGGDTDETAAVVGNGSDSGVEDSKNQRQQRALQAFLQG
ncbi:unnamed protein product, partial [Hapterophycus canaliculatus]